MKTEQIFKIIKFELNKREEQQLAQIIQYILSIVKTTACISLGYILGVLFG